MLLIVTSNFVVILYIFKNNDFQGRCRRSPGNPLKKGDLRRKRYLVTGLSEIKKPKIFRYIMHYLVMDRREPKLLIFYKMAASKKKKNRFFIKMLALNCLKKVFCGVNNISWLDYLKWKNQKDFVIQGGPYNILNLNRL